MKKLGMFFLAFLLFLSGLTFNVIASEPPAVDNQTFTIDKVVIDESGNEVDNFGEVFSIRITDDEDNHITNLTIGSDPITVTLPEGEYKIQEINIPSNYDLVDISVLDGNGGDAGYSSGTIHLTSDFPNIIVTITNRQKPAPPPPPRPRYASISLEKEVSPSSITPWGTVDYTLVVKNTGDYTLTDVTIDDPLLGELDEFKLGTLSTGASRTVTVSYVIPRGILGQLENTATVTGKHGSKTVSSTDTAVVEIEASPSIAIEKTVNKTTVEPGETVDYTFLVTNTGDVFLEKVIVLDMMFGTDWKHNIGYLIPGEQVTFTQSYTIPEGASGNLENIAFVVGSFGDHTVTDNSKAAIEIQEPEEIIIEKPDVPKDTPPDLPHTGGPVEPEILFVGIGGLLLAAGKILRSKK